MPEKNETHVLYKAIADFTALGRALRKVKKDLSDVRREEALLNSQSVAGAAAATVARSKHAKAVTGDLKETGKHTAATGKHTAAVDKGTQAQSKSSKVTTAATKAVNQLVAAKKAQERAELAAARAAERAATAQQRALDKTLKDEQRLADARKRQDDALTRQVEQRVRREIREEQKLQREKEKIAAAAAKTLARGAEARKNNADQDVHVNLDTGEILSGTKAMSDLDRTIQSTARSFRRQKEASDAAGSGMRRNRNDSNNLEHALNGVYNGAIRLNKGLDRLGNWHPRLIPPFIALIPIIAGILALLNPLVAGLGAVGAAALGFASSLGRVAAGAIGIIPAISTLISLIAALKMAFGGIGGAFKAFSNMKKAAGGGGGGGAPAKAELTRAEELTRAQEKYARAIQDVGFAQSDLDDARKGYIQRLRDLQKAVDRAAMSEARAAANSQLARENYANILADPGSTKGDKMLGKVGVDEAKTELQDVQDQNKKNAEDLAKMRKDGIDGDREVVNATRHLTDAIWAQRDAQLALINAQTGADKAAGGAASATDLYAEALAKLSPSARKFVEALVAMNGAWTAVKKNVQESFFSEFVGDIELLRDILPSVESLLSDTAGAAGRVVDNILKLVTSPKWQKDLILIGKQNVPIIENIGSLLLSWLDAFKDITVAAGPFLAAITGGMAEGAKNFRDFVAAARSDGSLASYLEDVRQRMSQWWRIVKNIGKALFNYSAAASDFGTWLTNGFERTTQSWLKSSEKAREAGSPFQEYLENIKPLLVEVKGLFADFFAWFARTASDPENIKQFTQIVKLFREDLGPALGRIFDILSKSGVGEDFVKAIVSIVEAIATLLENGGIDGIKAFYDTISKLFGAANDFFAALPKGTVSFLVGAFGTLAALRFFQVTALIGWLLRLGKSAGLLRVLKGLGNITGLSGLLFGGGGKHVVGKAIGARHLAEGAAEGVASTSLGAHGRRAAGSAGRHLASAGRSVGSVLGIDAAMKWLDGLGKSVKPNLAAKAGKGFNLLGSLGKNAIKGAGKGGLLGLLAGVTTGVAGDFISSSAAKGKKGAGQRIGGNALAGAGAGAGIGALAGSIVPGVGTAIGAGVGAAVGAGVGFATSSDEDKAAFFAGIAQGWNNFWGTAVPQFWADLSAGFTDWINGLGASWNEFWGTTWPDFWQGVADGWNNFITVDVPNFIGTLAADIEHFFTVTLPEGWNGFWGTTWPQFWQTLADGWNTFFTVTLPNAWNTFWGTTWPNFWKTLGDGWNTFFTVTLPNAWNGFWGRTWPTFWKSLADGWNNFFGVTLPNAWNGFWGRTWPNFWKGLADGWNNFFSTTLPNAWNGYWGKTFPEFWSNFAAGIGGFFGDIGRNWNNFWGGIFGNVSSAYEDRKSQLNGKKAPGRRNGGVIYRAGGGGVPGSGNSDTKAAMLTPGEFVVRKSIVNRVGIDNLIKFNAGVMSYAEMLQNAMANQPAGSKDDKKGIGFFDGGGLVNDFSFGNSGGGNGGGSDFPTGFGGGDSGDGGIHIENLVVNNPSPEPTSDSLPRSIRKLAYLGSRGGRG